VLHINSETLTRCRSCAVTAARPPSSFGLVLVGDLDSSVCVCVGGGGRDEGGGGAEGCADGGVRWWPMDEVRD
jgi:hypothetical protein